MMIIGYLGLILIGVCGLILIYAEMYLLGVIAVIFGLGGVVFLIEELADLKEKKRKE